MILIKSDNTVITDKKPTCLHAKFSMQFSLVGLVMAIIFIFAYFAYYTSLQTNRIAGFFVQIGSSIALIGSLVGFFIGVFALFKIAVKKFKERGVGLAVLAILFSFLAVGVVSPSMGIMDEYVYLSRVDSQVMKFLSEYNNDGANWQSYRGAIFDRYSYDMEKHTDENPAYIKLCCSRITESYSKKLPENFEVYIYKGLKAEFKQFSSTDVDPKAEFHQSAFPPKGWHASLTMEFSKDLCKQIISEDRGFGNFYDWNSINFNFDYEGCLRSDPDHPLIAGKLPEDFLESEIPVAYLPQKDLERLYHNASEIAVRFDSENESGSIVPDTLGVDVDLFLSVNGESVLVSIRKIETVELLPDEVIEMLLVFRRNLPLEYSRFFDFLKVPKLPPMPEEEKHKIRQCQVHEEWMKLDKVELVYGDFGVGDGFLETQNKLFPNSNFIYWGGGFGGSDRTHTITLYCPSCRKAEKKWHEDQGEDFEEVLKEYRQDDMQEDM